MSVGIVKRAGAATFWSKFCSASLYSTIRKSSCKKFTSLSDSTSSFSVSSKRTEEYSASSECETSGKMACILNARNSIVDKSIWSCFFTCNKFTANVYDKHLQKPTLFWKYFSYQYTLTRDVVLCATALALLINTNHWDWHV